eukprot:2110795-Pleurochrysis_carterae.AAC.3
MAVPASSADALGSDTLQGVRGQGGARSPIALGSKGCISSATRRDPLSDISHLLHEDDESDDEQERYAAFMRNLEEKYGGPLSASQLAKLDSEAEERMRKEEEETRTLQRSRQALPLLTASAALSPVHAIDSCFASPLPSLHASTSAQIPISGWMTPGSIPKDLHAPALTPPRTPPRDGLPAVAWAAQSRDQDVHLPLHSLDLGHSWVVGRMADLELVDLEGANPNQVKGANPNQIAAAAVSATDGGATDVRADSQHSVAKAASTELSHPQATLVASRSPTAVSAAAGPAHVDSAENVAFEQTSLQASPRRPPQDAGLGAQPLIPTPIRNSMDKFCSPHTALSTHPNTATKLAAPARANITPPLPQSGTHRDSQCASCTRCSSRSSIPDVSAAPAPARDSQAAHWQVAAGRAALPSALGSAPAAAGDSASMPSPTDVQSLRSSQQPATRASCCGAEQSKGQSGARERPPRPPAELRLLQQQLAEERKQYAAERRVWHAKEEALCAELAAAREGRPSLRAHVAAGGDLSGASDNDIANLAKDVREQEKLIAGYQRENERLTTALRSATESARAEAERRDAEMTKLSLRLAESEATRGERTADVQRRLVEQAHERAASAEKRAA